MLLTMLRHLDTRSERLLTLHIWCHFLRTHGSDTQPATTFLHA